MPRSLFNSEYKAAYPKVYVVVTRARASNRVFDQVTYVLNDQALYFVGDPPTTLSKRHRLDTTPQQVHALWYELDGAVLDNLHVCDPHDQEKITKVTGHRPLRRLLTTMVMAQQLQLVSIDTSDLDTTALDALSARLNTPPSSEIATLCVVVDRCTNAEQCVERYLNFDVRVVLNAQANDREATGRNSTQAWAYVEALHKAQVRACAEGVEKAQLAEATIRMPATYYAEVIRNKDHVLLACIVYPDTTTLATDREQQRWLQNTCAFFDQYDVDKTATWVFAGYETQSQLTTLKAQLTALSIDVARFVAVFQPQLKYATEAISSAITMSGTQSSSVSLPQSIGYSRLSLAANTAPSISWAALLPTTSCVVVSTVPTDQAAEYFALGCTGKIPGVLEKVQKMTKHKPMELDLRAQVSCGMQTMAEAGTTGILLGDQVYDDGVPLDNAIKAQAEVNEHVIQPYQKVGIPFRLVLGNHEDSCHGKGKPADGFAKAKAYVQAVHGAQTVHGAATVPQFTMLAPYYAEIVKDEQGKILAFILYADTNLLPIDVKQQRWLQETCALFSHLDPTAQVPCIFAGHHTWGESTSKRGTKSVNKKGKSKEGKKYANPEAKSGNQHELVEQTLLRLQLPLERFIVLAAHIHNVGIQAQQGRNKPLLQVAAGGGGSWSNRGDMKVFNDGTVFTTRDGGFVRLRISADRKVEVTFFNCEGIVLADPQQHTPLAQFQVLIDYPTRQVELQQDAYFDPILLKQKNQKSLLRVLQQIATTDVPALLSWYLAHHYAKEIAAGDAALLVAGATSPTCFAQLCTMGAVNQSGDVVQVLQAMLKTISAAADANVDLRNAIPLGKLYQVLRTSQAFLTQWQLLVQQGFVKARQLLKLHQLFIDPPIELTATAQLIGDNADDLDSCCSSDSEEEVVETSVNPLLAAQEDEDFEHRSRVAPLVDPLQIAEPKIETFAAVKALHVKRTELTAEEKRYLGQFIATRMQNDALMRPALLAACAEFLTYSAQLWDARYRGRENKAFAPLLLPWIVAQDSSIALVLTTAYFADYAPSIRDLIASHMPGVGMLDVDFRAKMFNFVALALELELEKCVDPIAKRLLGFLRLNPNDRYPNDDQDSDRQHASMKAIVVEYFHKYRSKKAHHDFLLPEFLKGVWSDAQWHRTLVQRAVPQVPYELSRMLYDLWQQEPQKTWFSSAADFLGLQTAAERTPLQRVADAVMCHSGVDLCLNAVRQNLTADEQAEVKFITEYLENPTHFTAFKALLIQARQDGWLASLPEAFTPEDINRATISQPTAVVPPYCNGMSSMQSATPFHPAGGGALNPLHHDRVCNHV